MALRPGSPQLESLLSAASAGGGAVTMQQLQQLFPFQLDAFQARSVEQLLAGKSVVVCAPTGVWLLACRPDALMSTSVYPATHLSKHTVRARKCQWLTLLLAGAGKTAIAEAAAAATLAAGRRVIYTTPLKALSNQKLQEKSARFGSARCGLQTGDTSLNPDADIVVMTTEILRNIMYRCVSSGVSAGGTLHGVLVAASAAGVGGVMSAGGGCYFLLACGGGLHDVVVDPAPTTTTTTTHQPIVHHSLTHLDRRPPRPAVLLRPLLLLVVAVVVQPVMSAWVMWGWWCWMRYTTWETLAEAAYGRRRLSTARGTSSCLPCLRPCAIHMTWGAGSHRCGSCGGGWALC